MTGSSEYLRGNGLDYRYVYGFQNLRLSVNISPIDGGAGSIVETGTVGEQIRLYYHQDLRGTVDYLTSPVSQKVESWTHYNEWGEITHNAVVKCGYREFDLVKNYTGHEYDAVLNLYYAKARMYDAENRRFTSVDPILDASRYDLREYVTDTMRWVQYLYVKDNAVNWIDPLGLVEYIPLYINGTLYENMAFVENGVTYISYQQSRQFSQAADFGKVSSEIVGRRKITYPPRAVHEIGSVPIYAHTYVAGDQTFYYTKFDCEEGVPLRDIANAGGVGHTISWWKEDGILNVVLNTQMKNAPVQVVREGANITITVYANFTGEANSIYNNWQDAYAQNEKAEEKNYISTKTFSELYTEGVSQLWSGTYSKHDQNGLAYDQFGDYSSVNVNVQFKTSTNSNQERLIINFDSTTPTDPDVQEVSHTSWAGAWSMTVKREVSMYDHYWGKNSEGNLSHSEYTVNDFKHTSAHEFGHVLGLGDAYETSGHQAAPVTPEVLGGKWLQGDMMRNNGKVSSNDIEMVLEAWKLNSWQTFVDNDPNYPKSTVVRLGE